MKLNKRERIRYDSGLHVMKTLATERSVISKRVKLTDAVNVPKDTAKDIRKILTQIKNHELYGSLASSSKTMVSRRPKDVDVAVNNPYDKALKIADILKRKGHNVRIESMPQFDSHKVQIKRNSEWVDVVDLHEHAEHISREFSEYGVVTPPDMIEGLYVQTMNDQMLRKGHSAMLYDERTETFGPRPHRAAKDIGDFITGSRLLIDSKELRAKAELARVKKARKSLKVWRKHAKTIPGASVNLGKDPIPEDMERRFIKFAVENPEIDVDDIKFKTKDTFRKKKKEEFDPVSLFDIEIPFIRDETGKSRIKTVKSGETYY